MNITETLAQDLVAAQFPEWRHLPVEAVRIQGHDNVTFRLGRELSIRLPTDTLYAMHVPAEHEWLPRLGQHLPLPIPEPVGRGAPGPGYPWPWSVNRWIEGDTASGDRIRDMSVFARDLAGFLNALQTIDADGGPVPGRENFFRGGDLSVYENETHHSIEHASPWIDADVAREVWASAVQTPADELPVWIHGDVAAGNLLVRDGRLCAVIDFGQLAVGDPACDLTIAWTFFHGTSRTTFQKAMHVSGPAWRRARGWALWKALLTFLHSTDPVVQRAAENVIHDVVLEHHEHEG